MAQEDNKCEILLNKLSESRDELAKNLNVLEECRDSVVSSISSSNDYRNKYAREERLKTLSSFFASMLQYRQEYNRTIQAEIDIRRKLDKSDNGEIEVDIRSLAKQLAQLNEENKQ